MRILSLITHFAHIPVWEQNTTRIDLVDKGWKKRGVVSRAWVLASLAPEWDRIVFWHDKVLPFIFWCFYLVRRRKWPYGLIFTTFLCDVSRFGNGLYERLRWFYLLYLTRIFDVIVVHSAHEVSLYASAFRLPESRFCFVPYCARTDALDGSLVGRVETPPRYVLAAGRHRDYATFAMAMSKLDCPGIIIAGESDRDEVKDLPGSVRVLMEVPFQEYRGWISRAAVFVVPLHANRVTRSLGQIAMFESIAKRVPVIAARAFQIEDYFKEDQDILCYEPENPEDLARQIGRILDDSRLRDRLVSNAYESLLASHTEKHYVESLLHTLT